MDIAEKVILLNQKPNYSLKNMTFIGVFIIEDGGENVMVAWFSSPSSGKGKQNLAGRVSPNFGTCHGRHTLFKPCKFARKLNSNEFSIHYLFCDSGMSGNDFCAFGNGNGN